MSQLNQYYHRIRNAALTTTLNWITEPTEFGHKGVIRSGHLKGYELTVPSLERLAYFRGTYEPHIVEFLQSKIKRGDVVYDIGANCGYLSMLMGKLVSNKGEVISFEPVPKNVAAIQQNLTKNKVPNVRLIQSAVSDSVGTITFATYGNSLIGHIKGVNEKQGADAKFVTMDATTLDASVFENQLPAPSLIKIDVEGAEEKVLLGGKRLFEEKKPIVLAEIRKSQFDRILPYMRNFGYECEHLEGGWELNTSDVGDIAFLA